MNSLFLSKLSWTNHVKRNLLKDNHSYELYKIFIYLNNITHLDRLFFIFFTLFHMQDIKNVLLHVLYIAFSIKCHGMENVFCQTFTSQSIKDEKILEISIMIFDFKCAGNNKIQFFLLLNLGIKWVYLEIYAWAGRSKKN